MKKVYKITFSDRTITECCDDHLWAVITPTNKAKRKPYEILPLKHIRKNLTYSNGNRRYYIPMTEPVRFERKEVPLDPYLLGYILANGSLGGSGAGISIPDDETLMRLLSLLPEGISMTGKGIDYSFVKSRGATEFKNVMKGVLNNLGLMGKLANGKFIPKVYLQNSMDNRIALFQGLMDGDGYAALNSTIQYTSVSKRLAYGVRELVHSFGGSARIKKHRTTYSYKGERRRGQDAYTLTIALPRGIYPFRLSRKSERHVDRKKYLPTRAFKSVEYVGKKECVCIKVDALDSLYLTNNYILTHNTPQALVWVKKHLRGTRNTPGPVVVLCPKTIMGVWRQQAKEHVGIQTVLLEHMKVPKKVNRLARRKDRLIYVINYDILGDPKRRDSWCRWLKSIRPAAVIADEAHYLSNPQAKRTRYFRKLVNGVRHVLLLTGTPITHRPAELWSLINTVRPKLFPSFRRFGTRYCQPEWTPWGVKYRGAARLKELHKVLKQSGAFIRRRKEDVLKDLPPKVRVVVPVELDQMDEYRQAEREFLRWLKRTHPHKANKGRRNEALVRLGYLIRLVGQLKLRRVKEWVDEFLEDNPGKLLAFGVHRSVLKDLEQNYQDIAVRVDGSVTGRKRDHAIARFLKDRKCRLFFGNNAAITGWSGKGVSYGMFFELFWKPGDHNQAEDRLHGLGRGVAGVSSTWYYLIGKGTVEEKVCKLIQKKQDILDQVLDGKPSRDGFDVMDRLEEELLNPKGRK